MICGLLNCVIANEKIYLQSHFSYFCLKNKYSLLYRFPIESEGDTKKALQQPLKVISRRPTINGYVVCISKIQHI